MRQLASTTAIVIALGMGASAALADEHTAFATYDADQDGQITQEEFSSVGAQRYEDAAAQAGDELFTRDYTEQRVFRDDEPVDTLNVDTDQNDMVSMDEAQADWESTFDSLDENDDGVIDESEWELVAD